MVYGYPETENNHLYNSAQLFDNEGQSIANHRKKLLPPTADESKIFTPGTDSTILLNKGRSSQLSLFVMNSNFQSLLESSL
ncbi:MAG: nitrilase-related carbon-nitrogen hydrolase [Candidatus Pseudothioglobus sp.]